MNLKKILLFCIVLTLFIGILSGCIEVVEDDNQVDDTVSNEESNLSVFNANWSTMWVDTTKCNSATDIMMDIGPNDQLQVVAGMHESKLYCDLRYYYYDYDWHMEIVPFDSDFMGEEADIVVDNSNIPHIVFIDETKNNLYYAKKDTNWTFDLIETTPSYVLNMGITLDSKNKPHVVYDTCGVGDDYAFPDGGKPEKGNQTFRYAYKENDEWNVDVISDEYAIARSVVVDSKDRPHTAFFRNDSVFYACKNASWQDERLDDMKENTDVVIAIDSNDIPHLLYKDNNYRLIHAYYDESWVFETLVEDSGPQQGSRIVIDKNDNPHIFYSYADESNTEGNNLYVNYLYKEDGTWYNETVCYGGEGDFVLDSGNKPHICFGLCTADTGSEQCELIKYAYKK